MFFFFFFPAEKRGRVVEFGGWGCVLFFRGVHLRSEGRGMNMVTEIDHLGF